jgi:hypothetical protein
MSTTSKSDRRQQNERRFGGERRKASEGRCAIFEVCRSMLHLALVARNSSSDNSGDRVVTRSVRWRNQATSLHTELGIQELTEAFRTLVSDERLAGARVRIALGGEFCVTRVITGPTEDVRREFAELEERSLRYLTLGPGTKALAGNTQQLDARHQHALLAVANQHTLDHLMQIAETVNLQIETIEPSLIALSRAQAHLQNACQEASLIIQLDEDVAELGICHRGRLLLDYRPGGHTNAENVAGVVALHLSRLQRYIERYHSYLDAPLRHVYLAGDTDAVSRARVKFAELPDFEVHVLQPADLDMPWKHAAEVPGTELAAALGTAMVLYCESAEQQGPNLIESALAMHREPMRPILMRAMIPLAAVLAVAASLFVYQLTQWREKSNLRAELDNLAPTCTRATELRLKLGAAERKLNQLQALEKQLPQPSWQQIFNHISQSTPEDVWGDRLVIRGGDIMTATFAGASYTDEGVYPFVNFLKQVPEIKDVTLEGTGVGQSITGPTTTFSLQLALRSPDDDVNKGGKP